MGKYKKKHGDKAHGQGTNSARNINNTCLKRKIFTRKNSCPEEETSNVFSLGQVKISKNNALKRLSQGKDDNQKKRYSFNCKNKKQPNGELLTDNTAPSQGPASSKKKTDSSSSLRERMMNRLQGARFRFLNEQIYTSDGRQANQLFRKDPHSFQAYHEGFQQQVTQWKINPLDTIIANLKKKNTSLVIADFGCGDARLANSLQNKVHSFDLVAMNPSVIACDMAHTPLQDASVDIVVFCLSLMGTNLTDFIMEASRVLRTGGQLKIAEVESRFDDVNQFIKDITKFGFKVSSKNLSHSFFVFMDFKKEAECKKKSKLPVLCLKPCIYKKR